MLRIVKTGGMGLAGLALAVLAVILVRGAIEAPARIDPAPLIERAADYDVLIRRDEWGVPHILGTSDADAAFGVGFAHAEDDYATIEDRRAANSHR